MARITIVTPAGAGTRNGNRHTALRWAAMLRAARHRVAVMVAWDGKPCDALLALHARRSHDSVLNFRSSTPAGCLVVTLTGTDLYRDLPDSAEARRSLELADRLIVLQDAALRELDPAMRRKARVVVQSSDSRLRHAPPAKGFRIAVVGHLRSEKDPLRTVVALSHFHHPQVQVVHIGAALDPALGEEAKRWMERDARYRWLGSLPHGRALGWMARSHLLVVSSVMEGGANVIAEAARIGTPVLASRVSGNVGMLGAQYPGYYPLHDDHALAHLITRAADDERFYGRLKRRLQDRRKLFAPSAERSALARVLREVLS
ncbi:MAG: TIGR04348 family glycosyltransferase [Pseudomonadota bacterium]|nr:TIGR04348 family glycosyltransferase [Pseudomonadota bacterium]